jgi:hypothetical protein
MSSIAKPILHALGSVFAFALNLGGSQKQAITAFYKKPLLGAGRRSGEENSKSLCQRIHI